MQIRALALALVAALALTGAACKNENPFLPSPSINVPFSATDLAVGTGAEATLGRRVTVQYTGWLYSTTASDNKGNQFDSNTLIINQLGTGVIQGFSQGIVGMRVGGRRRIVIPPALGYGNQVQSGIPANSTLLFEVALLEVQ